MATSVRHSHGRPCSFFLFSLVSYVRSTAHNSRSSRSNERDLRTCMHDSITLVISTPLSTLVTPRDLFIFWRLSALTIHHWNGCHFSGVLHLAYQMTPRDLFIFSRLSALARPLERVTFFRSATPCLPDDTSRLIYFFAPFCPRTAIGAGAICFQECYVHLV